MDAQGFLQFAAEELRAEKVEPHSKQLKDMRAYVQRIQGVQITAARKPPASMQKAKPIQRAESGEDKAPEESCCWVCEGWVEKTVIYSQQEDAGQEIKGGLFIHHSLGQFSPHRMTKCRYSSDYEFPVLSPAL